MSAPTGRARGRIAAGAWLLGALGALAATGPSQAADRLAPLLACRALADDAARLACFDRESAPLGARPPEPALSPEQKFGLGTAAIATKEAERGQPRADVDVIAAKVAELHNQADGRLVITLDNGQVWRQLAPGGELLLKVGDPVRVTRGAIGSFLLSTPSSRSCKVTRVR